MNAHGMRLAVIGICLSFFLAACGTVVAPETPADQPAAEASGAQGDQPAAEAAAPASGAPAAAGAADLSGDLVINTWGDVEADPNHPSYVLHTLIQQWAADHPNVNVTYQPMLGTVPDRFGYIATSLRSQTLADVVMQYFPSPAQIDPDLQYDFSADLALPNPYSTNPTWRDDFPLDGVALRDVTVGDQVVMVGTTYSGDLGDTAVLYNKDLLTQAGVTELPATWSEFYDAMAKLKEAGIDAFYMPSAGTDSYIFTWYVVLLSDQLMGDVAAQCDGQVGEPADGINSQKEGVWCIKQGLWSASHPGVAATFDEMKKWSAYFHEGYMAPSAPGNRFAQGDVAFFPTVRLLMSMYEKDPAMTFEWGSFYLPAMTDGETAHRLGNSGAGQGSQYLFIPKTTVDNGRLELARDLLQYVTSPAAIEYWCAHQPIPCFEPGTPIDVIMPDDAVKQQRYDGFINPSTLDNMVSRLDVNDVFGPGVVVQEVQILQDYLAGNADMATTLAAYQAFLEQQADNIILQNPDWNADSW
jgi:ABC-type glycerol-3-phosphate transport system substrate-binding protein